jgi:uncharacterized protein (DUF58 family)
MTKKEATSYFAKPKRDAEGMIDPVSLMKIKSMELRAKVIVEGFRKGIHRSPYHGFSVEFTEYRQYSPGDNPRDIDWRVYARSDRFYIKKFEDETNLRCHLLMDYSRSMGYGSVAYTKSQYAGTLAATLAYFLFTQGDAVGLATFDNQIRQYMPPRNRPGYLRRLMLTLEARPGGGATELGPPLKKIAEIINKRGLIVLISDLLTSLERLELDLNYLRASGHDVVIFNVLDPAELNFNFRNPALFQDIESGRNMYVEPAVVQKVYESKLEKHLSAVEVTCRKLGIDYHLFATDRPYDLALLEFLQDRMQRRKRIRHIKASTARRTL